MFMVALAATVVLALGWVAADWGGRRASTNRVVGEALAESNDLQRRGKYPEALAAARRAEGLAAGGTAKREVSDRAARRRADLELVLRLSEVQLELASSVVVQASAFDHGLGDRRYAEMFLAAGIDVDGLTPEAAAERLRGTSVAVELVAAIDEWADARAAARGHADPGWRHLLQVAQQADSDPWRCRIRGAILSGDTKVLGVLARSDEVAAQPSASLVMLGEALWMGGDRGRAVEVLREAQRRFSADIRVNHRLGFCLEKSGQLDEAARFYTAAVVLRPDSAGARLNLGVTLVKLSRLDQAVAEYREANRLRPDYAEPHTNLGIAL
ncbi:MAG: tetratricopeptide repeat protein, partial [Acidimicrobiales bacterium]|nr:tetratricopeptide repeat protein [Acidimicrobiales bacterium]